MIPIILVKLDTMAVKAKTSFAPNNTPTPIAIIFQFSFNHPKIFFIFSTNSGFLRRFMKLFMNNPVPSIPASCFNLSKIFTNGLLITFAVFFENFSTFFTSSCFSFSDLSSSNNFSLSLCNNSCSCLCLCVKSFFN